MFGRVCVGRLEINQMQTCPFTLADLEAAFPLQIPYAMELTDSYGDAIDETEPFRGQRWDQVPPGMLRKHFEAACFFSPEAMRYFLPAFIKGTLAGINEIDLPLDYLLGMLSSEGALIADEWRATRWKGLSKEQWHLLVEWLRWLKQLPEMTDSHALDAALETAESGIWN